MPFLARNNRIVIQDTDGEVAFDTNSDMPHIFQVFEGQISYTWPQLIIYSGPGYWGIAEWENEGRQAIASLSDKVDFIVTRARIVSSPGSTDNWTELSRWPRAFPNGDVFFQGSALLETGYTRKARPFCQRLIHIVPDNPSGQLVAFWQHSNSQYERKGGSADAAYTTTLDIKCWLGRFR